MLSLLKVYEQRTGRSDAEREIVDCETLQGVHLELSLDLLYSVVIHKRPFLERRDVVVVAVALFCAFLISSWHKKFLRSE